MTSVVRRYRVEWYYSGNDVGYFCGERSTIVDAYDAADAVTQVKLTLAKHDYIRSVKPAPDLAAEPVGRMDHESDQATTEGR